MTAWLRRTRQTRTPVHGAQSARKERRDGMALAYHAAAGWLVFTQMMLWVLLNAYDLTLHAVWQAALLTALPLLALWLLWRGAAEKAATRAGRCAALLLLPCLMLDGIGLQTASYALMTEMVPAFTHWAQVAIIGLLPLLTVLVSKENGVAYGTYALRLLLIVLYAFATVLVTADIRPERLWPLMGGGLAVTAKAAVGGVGAVWGVGMLYLPLRQKPARGAPAASAALRGGGRGATPFVWLPFALCAVWALWLGMVRPWRPEDTLNVGQKLTQLSQYADSILVCEAGVLFWMLLLPTVLMGTADFGNRILQNVAPQMPKWLRAAVLLAPGMLTTAFSPNILPGLVEVALPYRAALSALAAILTLALGGKGKGK